MENGEHQDSSGAGESLKESRLELRRKEAWICSLFRLGSVRVWEMLFWGMEAIKTTEIEPSEQG